MSTDPGRILLLYAFVFKILETPPNYHVCVCVCVYVCAYRPGEVFVQFPCCNWELKL